MSPEPENATSMSRRSTSRPIPDIGPRQTLDLDRVVAERRTATRTCVVIGAGGHGRELADIIRAIETSTGEVKLLGLVDDGTIDQTLLARSGIRFLGTSEAIEGRDLDVYLGVGYPNVRRAIAERITQATPPALVHPSAQVGSACLLGPGVVLAQDAVLTTNVRLGEHTHVNVNASVSHDCQIGAFTTICPGATVTGDATIGDDVFIGAGATVLPRVHIGDGAVVGAGAVVAQDVAPGMTVAGVPARPI